MNNLWMRVLKVHLTSTKLKKTVTFGDQYLLGKHDYHIQCNIYKYMSGLSDACTIKIDNLNYSDLILLIKGEFYDVEIECGYRTGNVASVFKGGVLSITQKLGNLKTSTAYILCTSKALAKFGQSRLNLAFNSGINMYSAIEYACRRAGIKDANISSQLKKELLQANSSSNTNVTNFLQAIVNTNSTFMMNTDASNGGSTISIFNALKSDMQIINVDKKNIIFDGGFPTLTNDGATISLFPTFSFKPGQTIHVDNDIFDIHVGASGNASTLMQSLSKNYSYYLDTEGYYFVMEVTYTLDNRGDSFIAELKCKSRSLLLNIGGANG